MHANNVCLPDATKHGCDHHDATNRIKIPMKTRHHAIPASRFVIGHIIEGASICYVVSSVVEDMVVELNAQDAANVVELFVQILVLQTTPFLDTGLMTWLYYPLMPYV